MRSYGEFEEYALARQRWLYHTAVLLCGDPHRAPDLVQTTLVKLLRHWSKAARADSVDAYARTVLTRTFLAEQRRGLLSRRAHAVEDPAPAADDPELRLTLLAALAELPPKARAMVILRYWEDLSVAEVASLMRCSESTVKSQCSRSLARLRTRLQDAELLTGQGS
ncbi:SigE family RNA polymerase sigma factor [Streptomyces johnsoniae]|uniref:SigE family RNA polymerase sigma factor n=1 Tax=Streptomyces johnsoniae TaxID=3075532 RepID=A0ABU2S316_9ACTN|nr:SigE family RNA polymerase sigma factor [Streptomyces sp. DSM 41886]MDT0442199.1 SigE family RNA polymerase sigma factor [Streptomyces sp. DSM 41886]